MERISQRERELLGYAPGSSDGVAVDDFRDVFGGPPRRFSSPANDPRRPRRESLDSFSPGERRSGSRLLEKPVFGGGSGSPASSVPRRSHLGGDFYSDIFPGSDSASSSPVKLDRDPLSSSPSPRISSPRRESLSGGAALPAQLSLSMKLTKAADYPTPNSPTQRAPYSKDLGSSVWLGFPHSPNATSRAVSENYDLNIDGQAFYRQSPLSRQASSGLEAYLEVTDSPSIGMEVRSKTDKTSLDAFVGSGRMHFSFYKWAGKGVTLIMPSHAKEKSVSGLARLPEVVVQAIELPLYNDDIPTATTPSKKSPTESKSSTLVKDIFTDKNGHPVSTTAEKRLTDGLESKSLHSNVTADSDTYNKNSRRAQVTMSDKQKLETENLHQLFNDGFDKEGNGDTVEQSEENKSFFKSRRNVHEGVNAKEQEGRESSMKHVEVASPIMQDTQVPLEEKMLGNRVNSVKGKVKEFIKIFNHESSPKRKGTFESQTRRSRGKDEMDVKIKDKVSTPATKMTVETKATKGSNNKPLLDTPTGITPISVAKKPYSMDFDIHMLNEPSAERNATSETFFGSTPKVIEASISDIEESHSDELDGCFVEQLSEDPSDKLQTDSPPDQIKTSDAKIREWSKGKEGNIRSLLSTLQYVLWPESGWKPVPLVDIIESTSVKRAYQKALLCLHPDKLQQKGAATHQKYIAEKVFDILQESWDHFNSITSF